MTTVPIFPARSKRFTGFEQDTLFRTFTCSDHDRGRSSQSHGARASDHQNRHHMDKCAGKWGKIAVDRQSRTKYHPGGEGESRENDHDRHEYCRDLIHKFLNGGLAALRFFHQSDDLSQRGVFARLLSFRIGRSPNGSWWRQSPGFQPLSPPECDSPVSIDSSTVEEPFTDDAVHGDLLTRTDEDDIAYDHFFHWDFKLIGYHELPGQFGRAIPSIS